MAKQVTQKCVKYRVNNPAGEIEDGMRRIPTIYKSLAFHVLLLACNVMGALYADAHWINLWCAFAAGLCIKDMVDDIEFILV